MNADRTSLGVNEYSFSQVTLEQLFIDLANRSETEDALEEENR